MSKPALGRGLGSLLPSQEGGTAVDRDSRVTPGLATLMQGRHAPNDSVPPTVRRETLYFAETCARRPFLGGLLLCADLLLCGFAILFVFRQQQPLGLAEMT